MRKITIEIDDDIEDLGALWATLNVVRYGRVSDNGRQYCFVTTFKDGVEVFARRTRAGTDVFHVVRGSNNGQE